MADIEIIQPIPREDPITLIEKNELVEGGPEGAANRQAIAIANNLAFLKEFSYPKFQIDEKFDLQKIFNDAQKARNERIYYASDFKILGDGSDESEKVLGIFSKAGQGVTLDFEGKTIVVDSQISVIRKKGFVLRNGYLKKKDGSKTDGENYILQLNKCEKFSIQNFDTDGNRDKRTVRETATHNVNMRQCKNFTVINCEWKNGTCDALQIDCITAETLNKDLHTQNGVFINCDFINSYRNNTSVIIAQNLLFLKCKFLGANGTLPAAGVDLETNAYGGDGLINNVVFDQCTFKENKGWQAMVTHHDNPRGIAFRNCVVTAPAHDLALWEDTNAGGILVSNSDTLLDNVRFMDFPVGASYALRLHPSTISAAVLWNCWFINCKQTNSLINVHPQSRGIEIYGGTIENCNSSISINKKSLIKDLKVLSSNTSIYIGTTGANTVIDSVQMTDITNARMIFSEAENTVIKDCILKNILGATKFAFIQAEKRGSVVKGNKIDSDEATTAYAISYDAAVGKQMIDNEAGVNLGNSPYYVRNATTLNVAEIRGNKGGTQNLNTPVPVRAYQTATRPAASAVPRYSSIFDSTLKKLITSDGANWYDQAGVLV